MVSGRSVRVETTSGVLRVALRRRGVDATAVADPVAASQDVLIDVSHLTNCAVLSVRENVLVSLEGQQVDPSGLETGLKPTIEIIDTTV